MNNKKIKKDNNSYLNKTKIRVVIIHGNEGSCGNDNWFPWLKSELNKISIQCETPNLPDPVKARSDIWLPYIKNKIKADENTILVGHSTGAVATMRYAEKNKIFGSILVGVYYTDLGYPSEKISGYFNEPWDWASIKNNQNFISIFNSQDDPFIPIEEPRFISKKLDADYHEFKDRGHFGEDTNRKDFVELLDLISNKFNAEIK